ncbi:unnamed protein product [Ostreobium quekettii]|uniref:Apple domain-containing protein n=1 Tax=Ostreobium quekettii TaxID=121088 RepID=A0A8S1J257_9CHLO|nr:unnamed protein product [Ostreobium quekettii]
MAAPMHLAAAVALAAVLALASTGASGCSTDFNVDYRGSDINNGGSNIVGSAQECCDKCEATTGCESWTYVKSPGTLGTGRKVGECWLKRGYKPGYTSHPCCTSGVVTGCEMETNYDYPGRDINNGNLETASSAEACCKKCRDRYNCVSWTYVKEYVKQGSQVGECWLKDGFKPNRRFDTCCTSGTV